MKDVLDVLAQFGAEPVWAPTLVWVDAHSHGHPHQGPHDVQTVHHEVTLEISLTAHRTANTHNWQTHLNNYLKTHQLLQSLRQLCQCQFGFLFQMLALALCHQCLSDA